MLVTHSSLKKGLVHLCKVDEDLRRIIEQDGEPPLSRRTAGFSSLVHIILEQQVSLASAQATYNKLLEALPDLNPVSFLSLDDEALRFIGFSRQKARYVRHLSEAICIGNLSLEQLNLLTDEEVWANLERIKGIGRWTSNIYLLMVLGRPDIWPVGDLAIVKSVMHVKGMEVKPTRDMLNSMAETWRPWRSVAARVLWNNYLIRSNSSSVTN